MAKQPRLTFPAEWAGFTHALRDFVEWSSAQEVAIALIGGLAVGVHAVPRATKDIDITVVTRAEPTALLESLARSNLVPAFVESVEIAAVSGVLPLRHTPSGAIIDFIFARFGYQHDIVDRAVELQVAGVMVPVATAEDLCFMKLIAARPQDLADVAALLKAAPKLDRAMLLDKVSSFSELIEEPDLANTARRALGELADNDAE